MAAGHRLGLYQRGLQLLTVLQIDLLSSGKCCSPGVGGAGCIPPALDIERIDHRPASPVNLHLPGALIMQANWGCMLSCAL